MDSRNNLHIFYIKDKEEHHEILSPKVDWRAFDYDNAYNMYNTAWTEICKFFKVEVPDDLPYAVKWAWDAVRIPGTLDDKEAFAQLKKSDMYLTYMEMYVESECMKVAGSMFSDAYNTVFQACKSGNSRLYDRGEPIGEYKPLYWLVNLFNERLHYPTGPANRGAWIFRDGSYIVLESASHRVFVEEFCGFKEYDKEREWVKVSLYTAYLHKKMTNAQWITVENIKKKYDIKYNMDWYNDTVYV